MILTSVDLDSFPVQRWARKGAMPKHLQREGQRICFRFEIVWTSIDETESILLRDGSRMPTYTFNLTTPGWVIGSRDLQAAGFKPWAFEWQSACADRKLEFAQLQASL